MLNKAVLFRQAHKAARWESKLNGTRYAVAFAIALRAAYASAKAAAERAARMTARLDKAAVEVMEIVRNTPKARMIDRKPWRFANANMYGGL